MTQELFRREVIDARRGSWLGAISLAQPLSLWAMTGFAVVAALAIGLFLFFGSYNRRSQVVGQLVPTKGLATILAPTTGVLSEMNVVEGGEVARGQTLAVITMPRATVGEGDTATAMQARLERRAQGLRDNHAAEAQLRGAQASGLSVQLATARKELAQLEAEISTRKGQVEIAQETLQRLRQLQGERYVSELQVKQQEAAHLETVSEMQLLQRQATNAQRSIAQLQQAMHELPGQRLASDAGYQRDLAVLEQEQLETQARGALTINASVDGLGKV